MYEQRYNPYAANVDIVKGYLRSGKVFFLGILTFLSLGLTVATLVLNPVSSTVSELMNALSKMGLDTTEFTANYGSYLSSGNISSVLSTVISAVFTILAAIAFIIMFAKSRSASPDSNPSSGVGIMRVLTLITFIFTIIAVVFIVALYVLFVIGISSVNEYFDGDVNAAATVQVITGIIVSLAIILLISYTSSQKNFYRSIKRSLNSVDLYRTGAVGYGVFNIIFAVFTGLSLIGTAILTVSEFSIGNLLLLSSLLLSFVTLITTASFALGYNRYIKREKYGYNDPYKSGPDAPYYPEDHQGYGAPSDDYNYPNYNMPPQQNMPPYNEASDPYYSEQDQTVYCPNCSAPVEGNQPFCTNCGYKF